jgi:molybdopterin converting factor small subunit
VRVTIVLPAQLRELTPGAPGGGGDGISVDPGDGTVRGALRVLGEMHPAVLERIVTEQFEVRPHLNLFVDRDNIRWSRGLDTPLVDGARVTVLPAVSGG